MGMPTSCPLPLALLVDDFAVAGAVAGVAVVVVVLVVVTVCVSADIWFPSAIRD